MDTMEGRQKLIIDAPAWYCFDRYTDLESYAQWEPNTEAVSVSDIVAAPRTKRVHFSWVRRLFGFPIFALNYSLRCQYHRQKDNAFFIQFDEVQGDLYYVMTVIEFRQLETGQTSMSYKSVFSDPYLWHKPLISFFGRAELRRHMSAFQAYVVAAQNEERLSQKAAG